MNKLTEKNKIRIFFSIGIGMAFFAQTALARIAQTSTASQDISHNFRLISLLKREKLLNISFEINKSIQNNNLNLIYLSF